MVRTYLGEMGYHKNITPRERRVSGDTRSWAVLKAANLERMKLDWTCRNSS